MTFSKLPPVLGMAGVISTKPGAMVGEEAWLVRAFAAGPSSTLIEWRGDGMFVVTAEPSHEAGMAAGSFQRGIPEAGHARGVLLGHYYGDARRMETASRSTQTLQRYGERGLAAFNEINGAWTGVVWNSRTQEALFVRDGLGIYTLFAGRIGDRIYFTTDLRVFQAAGLFAEPDEQAWLEFLHYLYVPAPRTVSTGVVAVHPGHALVISNQVRQERYAVRRFVEGPALAPGTSFEEALDPHLPEFEDRLLTAVRDSLPPTGRVVLTLSGGKDSSTLAVALSKICPDRVLALNVGAKDQRVDEAADAALVCKALGLEFQSYVPTDEELAHGVYRFARVQDQPVGDIAALPYFLAMSQLPPDCTVILDGTGNDYYFGIPSTAKGAIRYQRRLEWQKRLPGPLWPLALRLMALGPDGYRQQARLWQRPIEETFVAWEGWSADELEALAGHEVSFAGTRLWEVMRAADPQNWIALLTDVICGVWEPHTAYRKAVHFAHALGRAIRFPFIDSRLAAFVNDLPMELKYRNGVNKQILRAYMKRNLPREIVEKPKSPFVFDVNRILSNPVHRWPESLERDGVLKPVAGWSDRPIRTLQASHARAPQDARWQHRLYALCLLATVSGMSRGYAPSSGY